MQIKILNSVSDRKLGQQLQHINLTHTKARQGTVSLCPALLLLLPELGGTGILREGRAVNLHEAAGQGHSVEKLIGNSDRALLQMWRA